MSAAVDPRRILREAAERRLPCDLLPRQGGRLAAVLIRVEAHGLVLHAPGHHLSEGEDLRLRLDIDGRAWICEASVLRLGVPVPDRSQDGVLLGFLDRFVAEPAPRAAPDLVAELLPPNGPPISLLAEPVRLLDLGPRALRLSLPSSYPLVFPMQGRLHLRLRRGADPIVEVGARVRDLAQVPGALLYELELTQADEPEALLAVLEAIEQRLWGAER